MALGGLFKDSPTPTPALEHTDEKGQTAAHITCALPLPKQEGPEPHTAALHAES